MENFSPEVANFIAALYVIVGTVIQAVRSTRRRESQQAQASATQAGAVVVAAPPKRFLANGDVWSVGLILVAAVIAVITSAMSL